MQNRTTKIHFLLALIGAVLFATLWHQPNHRSSLNSHPITHGRNDGNETFPQQLPPVQKQNRYAERLQKRDLLTECHTRGCGLAKLCKDPTLPSNKATPWTTFRQIRQYGWSKEDVPKNDDEAESVRAALDAYDLPQVDDASWVKYSWKHTRQTEFLGKTYSNITNPTHGMILAVDNHAPKDTCDLPTDQIVPLSRWSDIAFLSWVKSARTQAQVRSLKYFIQVNIINDDTQAVMAHFCPDSDLDNLPLYPGLTFDANSDAGMTLLGTPNGSGLAWFLAQHKASLGATRQVTKIHIWETVPEDERDFVPHIPCMLVEVGDGE
ncbi:hypothetical protein LTR08_005623 [Meristemomyces frigidus]|nr:hypothetical protein LTR08_005623 [Meristemomyces frigidus]